MMNNLALIYVSEHVTMLPAYNFFKTSYHANILPQQFLQNRNSAFANFDVDLITIFYP